MAVFPLPASAPAGSTVTVLWVQKILNGDNTGSTALPVAQQCNKAPFSGKTNHDIATVRRATTTDGIHFTDLGPVSGLSDPTTVDYNKTRWVRSRAVRSLTSTRQSEPMRIVLLGGQLPRSATPDAFHYISYAESSDGQNWNVYNDINSPIASINPITATNQATGQTVTIPANPPIVPTQSWFAERLYAPTATQITSTTLSMTFAGYGVQTPNNDLLDYRQIGNVVLTVSQPALAHHGVHPEQHQRALSRLQPLAVLAIFGLSCSEARPIASGRLMATFGLLATIWGVVRHRSSAVPFAVGAYITAAYWFTSSTSFANPAVTMARAASGTFAGIRPNAALGRAGPADGVDPDARLARRVTPSSARAATSLNRCTEAVSGRTPFDTEIIRPGPAARARQAGSDHYGSRSEQGPPPTTPGRLYFAVIETPTGIAYHVPLGARGAEHLRPGDVVSLTTKPARAYPVRLIAKSPRRREAS